MLPVCIALPVSVVAHPDVVIPSGEVARVRYFLPCCFAALLIPGVLGAADVTLTIDPADEPVAAAAELVRAIKDAGESPGADTIHLVAKAVYTLPGKETYGWRGVNALPTIERGNEVIIEGNGAEWNRPDGATPCRFISVKPGGSLTLKNLEISGGLTKGDGLREQDSGGAIRCEGALILQECYFSGNSSGRHGGAIRLLGGWSSLRAERTQFINNTAKLSGGAIDAWNASLAINVCTFRSNSAAGQEGGALALGGDAQVSGTEFILNKSATPGGAIRNMGRLNLTGCTFKSNSSEVGGGALCNRGVSAGATLDDCLFEGNKARSYGGAIDNTNVLIAGTTRFIGNRADQRGGAISSAGNLRLRNCEVESNEAGLYGAGLFNACLAEITDTWFRRNTAGRNGGAILCDLPADFPLVLTMTGGGFEENKAKSNAKGNDVANPGNGIVTVAGERISSGRQPRPIRLPDEKGEEEGGPRNTGEEKDGNLQ